MSDQQSLDIKILNKIAKRYYKIDSEEYHTFPQKWKNVDDGTKEVYINTVRSVLLALAGAIEKHSESEDPITIGELLEDLRAIAEVTK